MKRVSLRRERPKHHRVRNTAIAVGAVGAATAGVRSAGGTATTSRATSHSA